MRVHELHSAAVHAPLALLPTAAAVDLAAALTGDKALRRMGGMLWGIGAGASVFAGLAGLAASQEVRAEDPATSDMMWLHGVANVGITCTAVGMTVYRAGRRPSVTQATLGLLACGLAMYTAYLGGEMVYERGVGVAPMPDGSRQGVGRSPALLSRQAPGTLLRDVVGGLRWLLGRAGQLRRRPVPRGAFGLDGAGAGAGLET
jgi:uncharacterized membrane protein